MLTVQLGKLQGFNSIRRDNLQRIRAALDKSPRFKQHMAIMEASQGTDPAWFGIAILLHRAYAHQLDEYLTYLQAHGIENRPIISGNFLRQPSVAMYCPDSKPQDFPGAEAIHLRGFFIGVHQVQVEDSKVQQLSDLMLKFEFQPQRVVLVTGAGGMLGKGLIIVLNSCFRLLLLVWFVSSSLLLSLLSYVLLMLLLHNSGFDCLFSCLCLLLLVWFVLFLCVCCCFCVELVLLWLKGGGLIVSLQLATTNNN
ncbi:unnamed protein product [Polarella glacialis]|uniref:Uncharacterized protein n=1 Tax=Polarella glacialis TaxID=89957 RepID=A0A813GE93_POLGL|nr:unnamed protein product [Polarella glacialis]